MTDQHSERICGRCGGPNVVWWAPSPLWNAVMRGGDIGGTEDFSGVVCPTCFAVLAEVLTVTLPRVGALLPFLMMVLILVFRPRGLMGTRDT